VKPPTRGRSGLALLIAVAILTVGAAPMLVSGADHLDAPNIGSISVGDDDALSVSKPKGRQDLNDLYVFEAASGDRTVLALTVNPAINLLGESTFRPDVNYAFHIDTNGDARADVIYNVVFGTPNRRGAQGYVVRSGGRELAWGTTAGSAGMHNGVRSFAGPRSDPFFFDLLGFIGTVKGDGTARLNDGSPSDFFVGLNTLAIILEVPNARLGGNGTTIGVWATTPADKIGRPAINTVFNTSSADKIAFNRTAPALQPTAMGGKFRSNVIGVLQAFSALDAEGAYADADAATLADILLPDVLTYEVGSPAAGPLNGRALADDVIDAELNIVTGGFPFAGRDGAGAIGTDGVGPHGDYLSTFPYLGRPH
jgi:hypothetical protein